jgi:hypothetical protein
MPAGAREGRMITTSRISTKHGEAKPPGRDRRVLADQSHCEDLAKQSHRDFGVPP